MKNRKHSFRFLIGIAACVVCFNLSGCLFYCTNAVRLQICHYNSPCSEFIEHDGVFPGHYIGVDMVEDKEYRVYEFKGVLKGDSRVLQIFLPVISQSLYQRKKEQQSPVYFRQEHSPATPFIRETISPAKANNKAIAHLYLTTHVEPLIRIPHNPDHYFDRDAGAEERFKHCIAMEVRTQKLTYHRRRWHNRLGYTDYGSSEEPPLWIVSFGISGELNRVKRSDFHTNALRTQYLIAYPLDIVFMPFAIVAGAIIYTP